MSEVDLTTTQESLLNTVIAISDREDDLVTASAIGAELGKTPGTIRNAMQVLASLDLVEGVPGPSGGYRPTAKAYHRQGQDPGDGETEAVPIQANGRSLPDTAASELVFSSVGKPQESRVEVQMNGTLPDVDRGDSVTIGPLPDTGLVVDGAVLGVDDNRHVLVCELETVGVAEPA